MSSWGQVPKIDIKANKRKTNNNDARFEINFDCSRYKGSFGDIKLLTLFGLFEPFFNFADIVLKLKCLTFHSNLSYCSTLSAPSWDCDRDVNGIVQINICIL